jgi:hypothetical protein
MSGFSADWLALREPFDAAARAAPLVAELRARVGNPSGTRPLQVLDLGAGAGSNLRYLAPRLGGAQRWRLVDHDRKLLAAAREATCAWARARGAAAYKTWLSRSVSIGASDFRCDVTTEPVDLAGHPVTVPLADVAIAQGTLVTAAALLDLVSEQWLRFLAWRCREASAPILFALTYDGRTICSPAEPEDAEALALFNRHQLGDKGFGPALGPNAPRAALAAFAGVGYELRSERSDWHIGPKHGVMQSALLDGWLAAAVEVAPERRTALEDWHRRRTAHVAAGHSTLVVGHLDIVGWT